MEAVDLSTARPLVAVIGETSQQMALRDPDIRLMLRVREDDSIAFAELVELYQHRLITVMHHLVSNKEEAEDLAQEVFLRVYRTRKKYRPKAKFSTWLFTIANNLALNTLRSRQRKPVVPLDVRDSGPLGPRPAEQLVLGRENQPSARMQQQELAAIVQKALEQLNERQRAAVVLNKFEDMNYAEIAEIMGLTTKAVKSLLSRAREKLRETLRHYLDMNNEWSDNNGERQSPAS
jgi:RNA polymerase sigma-70 factor (ECF subfamily)